MPPKQKITKEMLLSHALNIAKEQGISAVTSRSVAKSVGCSIQPVFSHFPTMAELRQATVAYINSKVNAEMLEYQDKPNFIARTFRLVLNIARDEPKLFEVLDFSDSFYSKNLREDMRRWESSLKVILAFEQEYRLTETEAKDVFLRTFFMLFGIATMIATYKIDISNDEAMDMIQRTIDQMVSIGKVETP